MVVLNARAGFLLEEIFRGDNRPLLFKQYAIVSIVLAF